MPNKAIIHVDMDAFFASVEIREQPALKGLPVVVGGRADSRGVVAAASYEARKFGVRSAMPMSKAMRLCPDLVRISGNLDLYRKVSMQIHDIFSRYTPIIEPLSLDEAFLDVSQSERLMGPANEIGLRIKKEIKDELDLIASVGIAPNKFVAKIASDVNKPNGYVVVDESQLQAFLDPLPVSRLWGAGKQTVALFDRLGIKTIAQLRKQSPDWLMSELGKFGQHLWDLSNGRDPRKVTPDNKAKSISNETTFAKDSRDQNQLESNLMQLIEKVMWRLRSNHLYGKTVQLKLRYSNFKTITRSKSLPSVTDSTEVVWTIAKQLLNDNWLGQGAIRLIGIGMTNLTTQAAQNQQTNLFENEADDKHELDKISDMINRRFGMKTLQRGRAKYTTE